MRLYLIKPDLTYFDENDRLVGVAGLRHYLTVGGMNTWGHKLENTNSA